LRCSCPPSGQTRLRGAHARPRACSDVLDVVGENFHFKSRPSKGTSPPSHQPPATTASTCNEQQQRFLFCTHENTSCARVSCGWS
jgi:hypothetical protein